MRIFGSKIKLPSGVARMQREARRISFPFKVYDFVVVDERLLIVCYDWDDAETNRRKSDGEYAGRNVECFTFDGKRVWLIPEPHITYLDDRKEKTGYYSIYATEDGELKCCGQYVICDLDPETGVQSNAEMNR